MSDARAKLAAAIAKHDGNTKAAFSARETLVVAQAYVEGLEQQVSAFADVDKKIAASRAARIEQAISAGKSPTIEISAELTRELAAKVEAENQLAGARQAVGVLDEKAKAADAAASRADLEKEYAAGAVLSLEAETLAAAIAKDFADLQRKYFVLAQLTVQQVRTDPETVPPNTPAYLLRPLSHIDFARNVSEVVERASALGTYESNSPEQVVHDASKRAVEQFFAALKSDAEAQL